jgi:LuxR family maltose regulon positive regulatory protein
MLADAEQAVATIDRRSQFWPTALLVVALAKLLLGRIDEADELFADVSEAGLEVGAVESVIVALAERALLSLERAKWVRAEEFTERGLVLARHARMEEYPTSAFLYAVAARVALYRGQTQRAHELVAHAQRLRPRLTHALPQLAVQTRIELARAYMTMADAAGAETMLREIEAIFRRRPDLGTLEAQVGELRGALKAMRAEAPGASSLTTAELRVLPYLATHLSFAEIGERLFVSRHTVKSHSVAIYRKLNVGSRNAAVERAREIGLL